MAVTKLVNQKTLLAASVIALLLIAGSIYLHLQQKHHLGRMNLNDSRVKPTDGVENLSKDDVTYVPQQETVPGEKSANFERKSYNNYEDEFTDYYASEGDDYANDASATTVIVCEECNENSWNETTDGDNSLQSHLMDINYDANIDKDLPSTVVENNELSELDKLGLSVDCLRCLCMTVNGCKPFKCAYIDPCGIYGISKYYWLDGGKHKTMENFNDYNEEDEEHRDYLRCVNDETCAVETVKNYIQRYQKDCNNDGIIDCQDHIMLHVLGPSGCKNKQLSSIHKLRMKSCLK